VTSALPVMAGAEVDRVLLGLLALASAALLLLVARRWPIVLAVLYLAVMGLVPIWTGVSIVVFIQPQVAVALLVLAVALPQVRRLGTRLTAVDLGVALFVLACLLPLLVGRTSLSYLFLAGVQYLGAYLVGRLLPLLVGEGRLLVVVTAVFAVVAALALVEYATGTNLFQSFPGSASVHGNWEAIQLRGGVARAEGAFGHSIALGASLALALPLVLAAPLPVALRAAAALLLLAAVVVTFSRISLVTACLGALLSLLMARELPGRLRALLVAGGAAVAAVAVPLVDQVLVAAGDEAADSAAYRGDLVSLIGSIGPLGTSTAFGRAADGSVSFGAFGSIDSALILHGLWFGWASLAVGLVLLAAAAGTVLVRRASAPTIAVVAQLPALATVALITQYASMFWFVAGLAVCAQTMRSRTARDDATTVGGAVTRAGERPVEDHMTGIRSGQEPLSARAAEGRQ